MTSGVAPRSSIAAPASEGLYRLPEPGPLHLGANLHGASLAAQLAVGKFPWYGVLITSHFAIQAESRVELLVFGCGRVLTKAKGRRKGREQTCRRLLQALTCV
jgi:hypothetical protein